MILGVDSGKIDGVRILRMKSFRDERGWFWEGFQKEQWKTLGLPADFVQENFSLSYEGVLRGLHYQKGEAAQGKLILLLKGATFTVAVDLRRRSSTFGTWESFELDEREPKMIYLPPGLAHGFVGLSDESLYGYQVTAPYDPRQETGVRWDDPTLNIAWPRGPFLVSPRDQRLPFWDQAEKFEG